MVGDSATDVAAARDAGVPVIAVSFGYSDIPAAELGADAVIDVEKDDLIETVYGRTDGQGTDAVRDLAGGPNTLVDGIGCVKKAGTVVFASAGTLNNFPANQMTAMRVTLKAVRGHSYQAVETAIDLISSGNYPVDLMATHQFGLDQVDLGVRSIGGEGAEDAIHVSIIPSRDV